MKKTAVILLNMGGPDSLDAVEPFLFNLFCDRDIFRFPFAQKFFARLISRRRAPGVMEKYRTIGGKSPINEWTEAQRSLLETMVRDKIPGCDVYTAMRYWHPFIRETAASIKGKDYEKIVLFPLYPHYSLTTTGSAFNEWNRSFADDPKTVVFINSFFDHHTYIKALNKRIDESLARFPNHAKNHVRILFSAHGTPTSLEKKGDPYSTQIQKTVSLVMADRNHSHPHHLCFQSKVGPVKWLGPATTDTILALAAQNNKHLLVVPVSFVSDHIETLHELDIEYRHLAEEHGIENFIVMKGLNDSVIFIEALKDLVLKALLKKE